MGEPIRVSSEKIEGRGGGVSCTWNLQVRRGRGRDVGFVAGRGERGGVWGKGGRRSCA